jgi:flavin reductase (DIM6/NTAB) family NADH-FMN oxidoreductase RutF
MVYNKKDIQQIDKVTRLKIINSITGIKPANLIGTINKEGKTNLAVFSSVVHLGSSPSLLGFITRPQSTGFGHTLRNIKENGHYTINHITPAFIQQAHCTSAKFNADISEFDRCNLREEYIDKFKAPFVKESTFKMAMSFKQAIDIELNGTALIIGEVEHIIMPDNAIVDEDIDLEQTKSVGISGLNTYYALKKIEKHPYLKVGDVPRF